MCVAGSGVAVVEEHREITSKIGLNDAPETLVAWVSQQGRSDKFMELSSHIPHEEARVGAPVAATCSKGTILARRGRWNGQAVV